VDPKGIKYCFWLLIVPVCYFHSSPPRSQELQKCQRMWFMTGVRKYSWHATTRMCQRNSSFDDKIYSKNQYWFM